MKLRSRFESDMLFTHHFVSTISELSGMFLAAQRARLCSGVSHYPVCCVQDLI
jgi:hypothetical protein